MHHPHPAPKHTIYHSVGIDPVSLLEEQISYDYRMMNCDSSRVNDSLRGCERLKLFSLLSTHARISCALRLFYVRIGYSYRLSLVECAPGCLKRWWMQTSGNALNHCCGSLLSQIECHRTDRVVYRTSKYVAQKKRHTRAAV